MRVGLSVGGGAAVTALKEPSLSEIPEAPVYRPSEEEFRDPIAFVQAIRERAEGAGICRIVPPKSWRPPKRQNDGKTFRTRRQAIHRLQEAVGFEDGREYNVRDYKAQADAFFQNWFGAEELNDEYVTMTAMMHAGVNTANASWRSSVAGIF